MHLVVKEDGRNVSEYQFSTGPIHIGRGTDSHVFLPNMRVSRQHAVIFRTPDDSWIVQDLDSANKTLLNDKAIHKAQVVTGDVLRIADFTIEIQLESEGEAEKPTHLEDTLVANGPKLRIITRDLNSEHAPDIRFAATRGKDFLEATEEICNATGLDHVLKTLVTVIFRQFNANHVWCALRNEPEGPMTAHTGKSLSGKAISLGDIMLNEKITYAVDNSIFLLFPALWNSPEAGGAGSAMIAPILDPTGCFGALYVDNAVQEAPYQLSDLDYLMLLAIHTAAIVENF